MQDYVDIMIHTGSDQGLPMRNITLELDADLILEGNQVSQLKL